jgi:hypothetical protein
MRSSRMRLPLRISDGGRFSEYQEAHKPQPQKDTPKATPKSRPGSCGDVPPNADFTCKQQAGWGQVGTSAGPYFARYFARIVSSRGAGAR